MFAVENIISAVYENRKMICQSVFAVYLILLSAEDIRKRKVHLLHLAAGIPICVVGWGWCLDISGMILAAGGIVGLLFFIVSRMTGEAFGYGDSFLITVMGGFLGLWNILTVLMTAFLTAAFFSGILLIAGKRNRKTSFPFIPFLAAAYVGGLVSGVY